MKTGSLPCSLQAFFLKNSWSKSAYLNDHSDQYTRKDEEDNKHICIWVDKLNVLFVVLYNLGWMGLEWMG